MRRLLWTRPIPPPVVMPLVVSRYAPGDVVEPGAYRWGDVVFTQSPHAWLRTLIHLGQQLRFGWGSPWAHWSHVALLTSDTGELIQAHGHGIEVGHLDDYHHVGFHIVHVQQAMLSEADRAQAVAFARSRLGEPYGYLTFLSIALSLVTGLAFSFGLDGEEVCSGLVARALERGAAIFRRDPRHMSPGDLAQYFGVVP